MKPATAAGIVKDLVQFSHENGARFVFSLAEPLVSPKDHYRPPTLGDYVVRKPVVAIGADKSSAWVAADLGHQLNCGAEHCSDKPVGWYHMTVLYDDGAKLRLVAWHVSDPKMSKDAGAPKKMRRGVAAAAAPVVALFEASISSPAALAKTVSTRADVALLGSAMGERYAGGAKVAETLVRWKLSFRVRDGIQAGLTSSGRVAWVAANLDSKQIAKPSAQTHAYRALFVYEKQGAVWRLVQAHFSRA